MKLRQPGKVLFLLLAGANVASVAVMLLCGLSQRVNPAVFTPLVAFGLTFPIYLLVNLAFLVFWCVFKARYAWISVIGLVLGFNTVRTYCPVNITDPHPRGCIKVMSYNVKCFLTAGNTEEPGKQDLLDYIAKSDADIICFQEYAYPPNDKGEKVKRVLSRWPYRDSVLVGEENGNTMGICSRYRILRRYRIPVNSQTHGSVAYTLQMGRDTILVINNHFVSNAISGTDKSMYKNLVKKPSDMSVETDVRYLTGKVGRAGIGRAGQADSVAAFIDRHPDCPIILCGDFNNSPVSYVHYRMTRTLSDAYVATGTGPGISYHEAGMYFRLDNILCSKHWKPYDAKVDSHIGASDHYPVLCYLRLLKK